MGEKTFANGNVHYGQYRHGQPEGHGVGRFANGDEYNGCYQQGHPSGRGTFRCAATSAVTDGYWWNGEQHGPAYHRSIGGYFLQSYKLGRCLGSQRMNRNTAPPLEDLWEMMKGMYKTGGMGNTNVVDHHGHDAADGDESIGEDPESERGEQFLRHLIETRTGTVATATAATGS